MYRRTSFHIYMAALTVVWLSSFTIRYKVQGQAKRNTRHRQCQLRGYQTACTDCSDSCKILRCGRLSPDGYYVFHELNLKNGLEDGTKCGNNKICNCGECIDACPPLPVHEGQDIFHDCRPAQPLVLGYTRSQQCIDHGYAGACSNYETPCNVLYCARLSSCGNEYVSQKVTPRLGVEIGTQCGPSRICVDRKCVNVIGEMPIYVGNEHVYWRKTRSKNGNIPIRTRHQQCKDYGLDAACEDTEDRDKKGCARLFCGYEIFPGYYVRQYYITGNLGKLALYVASGTKCGEFSVCRAKKCVNIWPSPMPRHVGEEIYKKCHRVE